MLKKKLGIIFRLIFFLGLIILLACGISEKTQAAVYTCTWQGTTTDWYETSNWSGCVDESSAPTIPNDTHSVVIPSGQSAYPVLTIYQDQVEMYSLTIQEGAQITINEQTTFFAYQVDNYGTIRIEDVSGHNLRIQAPFNNYGVVNSGIYATVILYESGTHSGSFIGDYQLSFIKSTDTERTNIFQVGSSINTGTIFVDEYNSVNILGSVTCDRIYIRSNSVVDVSNSQSSNLNEVILQGGKLITSSFNIPAGDTFSGSGTIESNLTNAGTLSPGSSPGTLTVDGNFTQEASGTLAIELGGTTPSIEYDQLVVTGTAAVAGTLDVSFYNEFSPSLGESFSILIYSSLSGTFDTLNLPPLDSGLAWEVDYGSTAVTLSVGADGGSISGEVTYTGNHGYNLVNVGLFLNPNDAPVTTVEVTSGTGVYSYSIPGIPSGTYYIGALMDLNGNHQPDLGEPFDWYGAPDSLVISTETSEYTDIDFQLNDPFMIFLPLLLK